MVKAIFSFCENLQEKYIDSFFSSLQLFSSIDFPKKQTACHLLLGRYLTVWFHLISITRGMAANTHRTLSPNLFSHWMLQFILGVFFHHSENVRIYHMFLWTWEFGPHSKSSIFIWWNLDSCNLNPDKKYTGSFFSLLQPQLLSHSLVFWKKQAASHFLLGHLTLQFHLIRVTTGMVVNTPKTHSPNIFSHGDTMYNSVTECLHTVLKL